MTDSESERMSMSLLLVRVYEDTNTVQLTNLKEDESLSYLLF